MEEQIRAAHIGTGWGLMSVRWGGINGERVDAQEERSSMERVDRKIPHQGGTKKGLGLTIIPWQQKGNDER